MVKGLAAQDARLHLVELLEVPDGGLAGGRSDVGLRDPLQESRDRALALKGLDRPRLRFDAEDLIGIVADRETVELRRPFQTWMGLLEGQHLRREAAQGGIGVLPRSWASRLSVQAAESWGPSLVISSPKRDSPRASLDLDRQDLAQFPAGIRASRSIPRSFKLASWTSYPLIRRFSRTNDSPNFPN